MGLPLTKPGHALAADMPRTKSEPTYRQHIVSTYITWVDKLALEKMAREAKISRSAFVRRLIKAAIKDVK